MSEIIEHLEKFRDNLTKLSGRIETESGYNTNLFQPQSMGELDQDTFSKSQSNLELFHNDVKTLVDENNSLQNELKKVISEQDDENLRRKIYQTEQIELAQKKKEMAEEMCGIAMEHVDRLEKELEYVKEICDVPGVYHQLQNIQFEYRRLVETQNRSVESMQCELYRLQRENKVAEIQIEDYRLALENVRTKVKNRCSKMGDIQELRMIYDDKIAELTKQAEDDMIKIEETENHVAILENESYKGKECIAMLRQEIGSLEETKERLTRENKKQEELLNNLEIGKMRIRQELAQKEEDLDSLKKQIKDVIEEVKSNSLEQIKMERVKQEQAVQNTKNDNIRLNQENTELRGKLSMEQEHHRQIQSENDKAKNEMMGQIQKLYDSKNVQDKKISSLSAQKATLSDENRKMKERMSKIVTKGNDESKYLNKQTELITSRLKLMEKENEQNKKNTENLIDQKNSLLEETREELKSKNRECIYLKSKLKSLNDDFKKLRADSESQIRLQTIEKESIIEEMNGLLEEQRNGHAKWKNECELSIFQKDQEIESLMENYKKLGGNDVPLSESTQKYEREIEERDEIIRRHQSQYLDLQAEVAKYRRIMKDLSRRAVKQ